MNDFEKGQWREGVEPDMQIHGTPAQVVAIVERGDIGFQSFSVRQGVSR